MTCNDMVLQCDVTVSRNNVTCQSVDIQYSKNEVLKRGVTAWCDFGATV